MGKINSCVGFPLNLRSNNFDLLRFILSLIVFLAHSYVLSGSEGLSILNKVVSSDFAVKSFFCGERILDFYEL